MKFLRLTPAVCLAFLMLLGSCRSADSLFQKAIEKGLKIDTVWSLKYDTVKIAGVNDTVRAEVDTSAILQLCRELVAPPMPGKPRPVVITRIQEEVCPDIDSTYSIKITSPDTVMYFDLRILAKGGLLVVKQHDFEIPVAIKKGTTTIRPGIPTMRAWVMCGITGIFCFILGALVFFWRSGARHYTKEKAPE